jgi:hypothetical protein
MFLVGFQKRIHKERLREKLSTTALATGKDVCPTKKPGGGPGFFLGNDDFINRLT